MADPVIIYSGPIVTRQEALSRNEKRYFSGRICPNAHLAERFVSSGSCSICTMQRAAKSRKLNPKRHAEYSRRWEAKNPERHREIRKRVQHRSRWKNIELSRAKERAKEKRNRDKRAAQIAGRPRPSCCDVCGKKRKRIAFDHCHSTGNFRGFLCSPCNVAIGLVGDSPKTLRALARYLEKVHVTINDNRKEQTRS